MRRNSLQFRLVLAFTAGILLTGGSVFVIVWQASTQHIRQFSQRVEGMVSGRIQFMIADYYSTYRTWDGVQPVIIKLGDQFKYRIILADNQARIIADSDNTTGEELDPLKFSSRTITIPKEGVVIEQPRPAGGRPDDARPRDDMPIPALLLGGDKGGPKPPEPPVIDTSNLELAGYLFLMPLKQSEVSLNTLQLLSNELGRYFFIGALMAVVVAIVLTFFLSRRILAPVKELTAASHRLGKGDFSQRVKADDKSEIGELAATFNLMAADLERGEKLRRNMVADIAHELRSPLTNVRGYLEGIRDGILQADAKTIGTIYDETMLLSRLVHDLQELSLAEAGQLKLFLQPENAGELITQAVSAVKTKAAEKEITLSIELKDDLPPVLIDTQRIRQVLHNLLANALTHTPPGGRITVRADRAGSFVSISVIDTGEGIPAEDLPLVFERFHRVDKSRARATGGSGLGLTIARYFVEAHNGEIIAESEPGRGSAFTFTLPADETTIS